MCLFTFPNRASAKALYKGITHFECGGCPECMQKKSRLWALRCGMQARVQEGVMVTLTYDTYKVGSQFEENPTDPTLPLSKRDCQLFIKRLRKHFEPAKIKYLLTAERGKRTHRAHYHALLFGVHFDDLIKYKKSDRGNWIYKSKTLENIWKKGICTVDCTNLNAKTARYCTKYCAKDAGNNDTFMLFSRGIGDEELLRKFNGISYWLDGREYSIPKQIWQKKIEEKYNIQGYSKYVPSVKLIETETRIYNNEIRCSSKIPKIQKRIDYWYDVYENHKKKKRNFRKTFTRDAWFKRLNELDDKVCNLIDNREDVVIYKNRRTRIRLIRFFKRDISHERGRARNEYYQYVRDNDFMYKRYLAYWKNKANIFKLTQPSEFERILDLPNDKYRSYKSKAIICKHKQLQHKTFTPPRSNCNGFNNKKKEPYVERTFAPLSRHYRANDTKYNVSDKNKALIRRARSKVLLIPTDWKKEDLKIYKSFMVYNDLYRHQSLTNS